MIALLGWFAAVGLAYIAIGLRAMHLPVRELAVTAFVTGTTFYWMVAGTVMYLLQGGTL